MEKAIVIYQSKNGTTKQLGSEIAEFLNRNNIQSKAVSVEHCNGHNLSSYDYIFLGCWTKGLMFFNQHPDKIWQQFVNKLRLPEQTKIGLFTTYKIATGSMFRRMIKCLPERNRCDVEEVKSKSSTLSSAMIARIEGMIQ